MDSTWNLLESDIWRLMVERSKFVNSILCFVRNEQFQQGQPVKEPEKNDTRRIKLWKRKRSNSFTCNDVTRCFVTRTINLSDRSLFLTENELRERRYLVEWCVKRVLIISALRNNLKMFWRYHAIVSIAHFSPSWTYFCFHRLLLRSCTPLSSRLSCTSCDH